MPTRMRLFAVGALAIVVGVWWGYPSAARDSGRLDVVIVGDGQVRDAAEPLARHVRGLGLRVELIETDVCAADAALAQATDAGPSVVVLSPSAPEGCAPEDWAAVRDAAGDARMLGLVQPGVTTVAGRAALAARGVEVVDATVLLGTGDGTASAPRRLPCQWWDDCEPDGWVTVRAADGTLTPAGGERLARTLAGRLS